MSSSLTSTQRKSVSQLRNFTGVSEPQAITLLRQANWSVERAADAYFSGDASSELSSSAVPPVDNNKLVAWFESYADKEEPDQIVDEGVMQLCEDIGVDTQDVVTLVLAWQMECERMCVFTRQEWLRGMTKLGVDSASKLAAQLPRLRGMVSQTAMEGSADAEFRSFYNFVYAFAREQGQKSLQLDVAVALWRLLLTEFPLVELWCAYLEEHHKHAISKDTWACSLDFLRVNSLELTEYNEADAWPSLVDDFVDHRRKAMAGTSSA